METIPKFQGLAYPKIQCFRLLGTALFSLSLPLPQPCSAAQPCVALQQELEALEALPLQGQRRAQEESWTHRSG
ncbi:unnamed protein product [Coccothraustes coccothraustes]